MHRRTIAFLGTLLLVIGLALTSCGNDDSDTESSGDSDSGSEQSESSDVIDHDFDVSWQDALDQARDHFDGDVTKIELEQADQGIYEYKIELMSDTEKFALEVDAESGDEIGEKHDSFDADKQGSERKEKRVDVDQVISLSDAADAARQVHDGPVNKWKLEGKSSGPQYEFDITKGDSDDNGDDSDEDWEVQIDAKTGKEIPDD